MDFPFRKSRRLRSAGLHRLLPWVGILLSLPAYSQVVTVPPPAGLSGETIVTPPPAQQTVIYHVGLLGLLNKTRLEQIDLIIEPLQPPMSATLDPGNIRKLILVESTNHLFGDGDDVELNDVRSGDIALDGSVTSITDDGKATPVGLFPLPVGELVRHYFVVAEIASSTPDGAAFRVGAPVNHLHVSTPTALGTPVWASNDDRIVVGGLATPDPPQIALSPTSHEFDPVLSGSQDTVLVQVSNTGTVPARIDSVRLSNDQFDAFPDTFSVSPGESATLGVVHAPTRLGPITGRVMVHVNGLTDSSIVLLSGFGSAGGLTASTTSIDMGNITFGETAGGQVLLTNGSGMPIEVTGIVSGDAQFTADRNRFTLAAGETIPVNVQFNATSLGTKTATLTIHHEADLTPILVDLRADATVAIATRSLSYGRISVGETANLPVRIDNPSAAPVTITSILSDNPRFVPDCTTCVIPPGGSQEIRVAFTPIDDQVARATLSITHNPTILVAVVANNYPRNTSPGVDASRNPLPTVQVPFGGEALGAVLCALYLLRRRWAA